MKNLLLILPLLFLFSCTNTEEKVITEVKEVEIKEETEVNVNTGVVLDYEVNEIKEEKNNLLNQKISYLEMLKNGDYDIKEIFFNDEEFYNYIIKNFYNVEIIDDNILLVFKKKVFELLDSRGINFLQKDFGLFVNENYFGIEAKYFDKTIGGKSMALSFKNVAFEKNISVDASNIDNLDLSKIIDKENNKVEELDMSLLLSNDNSDGPKQISCEESNMYNEKLLNSKKIIKQVLSDGVIIDTSSYVNKGYTFDLYIEKLGDIKCYENSIMGGGTGRGERTDINVKINEKEFLGLQSNTGYVINIILYDKFGHTKYSNDIWFFTNKCIYNNGDERNSDKYICKNEFIGKKGNNDIFRIKECSKESENKIGLWGVEKCDFYYYKYINDVKKNDYKGSEVIKLYFDFIDDYNLDKKYIEGENPLVYAYNMKYKPKKSLIDFLKIYNNADSVRLLSSSKDISSFPYEYIIRVQIDDELYESRYSIIHGKIKTLHVKKVN